MAKHFCFSFHIDTHLCMKTGVPNLINLGKELDCKFTFFVNMGRAISRYNTTKKLFTKKKILKEKAYKFSPLKKLGPYHFGVALFLNPKVGAGFQKNLQALHQAGHEIGLHGGKNHATWQNNCHTWNKKKLRQELQHGLQALQKLNIVPLGFASPGWNNSEILHEILQEFNFQYLTDRQHSNIQQKKHEKNLKVIDIPTNITGGKIGSGYLEYQRAKGLSTKEILNQFEKELLIKNKFAIIYDHPFYAGIHELETIRSMIQIAKTQGFEISTIKEIIAQT